MSVKCYIRQVIEQKIECPKAIRRLATKGKKGEVLDDNLCPWHIDSKEHGYCFWAYMRDNKDSDVRTLVEISKLLNTSINNVKLVLDNTLQLLKNDLHHLK